MFRKDKVTIKVNKQGKIIAKSNMSNNQLATSIRLLAKFILNGSNSKFTVEQVLSGLSMNMDYQKQYNYCEYCDHGYPNMEYQGFNFCPHCGSKLYKGKL